MTIGRVAQQIWPFCVIWNGCLAAACFEIFLTWSKKSTYFQQTFRGFHSVREIFHCTEYKECNLSIIWHFSICCQFLSVRVFVSKRLLFHIWDCNLMTWLAHSLVSKLIVPYKLLVQIVDLNGPYQSLNTAICSTVLDKFTNHRTCFYYTWVNACAKKNWYITVFCSYQNVQTAYIHFIRWSRPCINES